MDEPVRLTCPDCQLVYRIKRLRPGKEYACRNCGGGLHAMEPLSLACPACGSKTEVEDADLSALPHCEACNAGPRMIPASAYEESVVNANRALSSSARTSLYAGGNSLPASRLDGGDLARLPRLIDTLLAGLEELKLSELRDAEARAAGERRVLEAAETLSSSLRVLDDRLSGEFRDLDGKVAQLISQLEETPLSTLADGLRETDERILARLDAWEERVRTAGGGLPANVSPPAVEMDTDELAEKLMAGMRLRSPQVDDESGAAVDALVRVADGLVKEQSDNTARLDRLADEIRAAAAALHNLDDWRGMIPARVADELGRTVEERVVGPLSNALARQAPAILSDLQDNKLVDIVSRSVREAQRPLLREILSGGRGGVPFWLFTLVLILFIGLLGFLVVPGIAGLDKNSIATATVADSLDRIEQTGIPLTPEDGARFGRIESVMADIRDKAMAHAANAATLEQEVRDLKRELERQTQLNERYVKALEDQTRKVRTYESRLNRLGVSPDSLLE